MSPSIQKLEHFYSRIRNLLDGHDEVLLDEQGSILTWNRNYQQMQGYSGEEIIGQHLNLFLSPSDRQMNIIGSLLHDATLRGSSCRFGKFIRRDGTMWWGSLKLTAIRNRNEIMGFIAVLRQLPCPAVESTD